MLNAKLAPVLVMVAVTAAMWGCGDDDKPNGGTGGRNTAGTSGKGGSAGGGGTNGGTAGKGSGGAGTGGTVGGTARKGGGGAGAGGKGGSGGAGAGGTSAGTGGTMPGGMGGEGGEEIGGAGGEGGASGLTLAQACAATCQDQSGLACDNACTPSCVGLAGDTSAPTEYAALIQCQAAQLGPSDYVCREQPSFPAAPDMAGLVWNGPCETELCAWTCLDGTFVDEDTFGHCGC